MIIIEFIGGLGNQMFQYGMYCLLKKKGIDVKCAKTRNEADRPFSLSVFPNVEFESAQEEYNNIIKQLDNRVFFTRAFEIIFKDKRALFIEDENKSYDDKIFQIDNKILRGYFQSLDYLLEVQDELRTAFQFPKVEEKLEEFVNGLPSNVVSVHVRRGDFLKAPKVYGGICTESYYRKAIEYMKKQGNDSFLVVSDDTQWVIDNFDLPNAIVIEQERFDDYQDWYDMYIMSHCPNNILANSTFSWWAAWLNSNPNKVVVSPSRYENLHPNKHLLVEDWVIINSN